MGTDIVTRNHKTQKMGAALYFLHHYHNKGQDLLNKIVIGDETWVQYQNVEMKDESKQWKHSESSGRPVKFKQMFFNKKLMATLFWDQRGTDWI